MERLTGALDQCTSPEQTEFVRAEQTSRKKLFDLAQEEIDSVRKLEQSFRAELESKEARFAQDEVLDFLRSGRYSFTPLHLANAIAGLPFVASRTLT